MAGVEEASVPRLQLRIQAAGVLPLSAGGERGFPLKFNIGQTECPRDSEIWVHGTKRETTLEQSRWQQRLGIGAGSATRETDLAQENLRSEKQRALS